MARCILTIHGVTTLCESPMCDEKCMKTGLSTVAKPKAGCARKGCKAPEGSFCPSEECPGVRSITRTYVGDKTYESFNGGPAVEKPAEPKPNAVAAAMVGWICAKCGKSVSPYRDICPCK